MDKPQVRVEWIDASDPKGDSSWYTDKEMDDFASKEVRVVSLGYIKSETKLYLTLAADYVVNEDGSIVWGRPTKIPPGMIQKREVLVVEQKEP